MKPVAVLSVGAVVVTSENTMLIAVAIVALLVGTVAVMAMRESAARMRVTTALLVGQQRAENSTT